MHKNIITKLLTLKIRTFLALYLMYCRFPRLGANLVPYVFHLFSLSNADATPYIFFLLQGEDHPLHRHSVALILSFLTVCAVYSKDFGTIFFILVGSPLTESW